MHQAFRDDINMDVEQAMAFGLIDSVLEPGQIVGHRIHIQPPHANNTPQAATTAPAAAAVTITEPATVTVTKPATVAEPAAVTEPPAAAAAAEPLPPKSS